MDSTPFPIPFPIPPLKPSASKLPIKRKTQTHGDFEVEPTNTITTVDFDSKPPPFKFHRIWTEADEIRFLQGLLHSSNENLCFPRDLSLFYHTFSHTMSQPYTKSQLSEKLRRLRKKFRVTSSRISRGLDISLMSAHDRSLFDLSNKLWSSEYASTSPFGSGGNGNGSLVGVKVSFSPVLDFNGGGNDVVVDDDDDDEFIVNDNGGDVKMSEGYDLGGGEREESGGGGCGGGVGGGGIGGLAAKSVLNVFDECLKDVRMALGLLCSDNNGVLSKEMDFQRRWREQQVAEFDILARRLRLVLDKSLNRQS